MSTSMNTQFGRTALGIRARRFKLDLGWIYAYPTSAKAVQFGPSAACCAHKYRSSAPLLSARGSHRPTMAPPTAFRLFASERTVGRHRQSDMINNCI